MHWVLFVNGENTFSASTREVAASADRRVAVDGGSRHLSALGLLPHIVLGDMDSIPAELFNIYKKNGIELHLHPAHKDATDLELALELAIREGASKITLLGATGGRLDHTLGNLFLLTTCQSHGVHACIRDAGQSIYLVTDTLHLQGTTGDTLSLIPITSCVEGMTLTGLEYPLQNARLNFGSTLGISNVFIAPEVSVTVRNGQVLVIHLHPADKI